MTDTQPEESGSGDQTGGGDAGQQVETTEHQESTTETTAKPAEAGGETKSE